MRTVVVVPTYQEADNIAEMLRRVRAALPDGDVLVVDDSSPDGTADLARAVGDELGGIDVTVRTTKTGLGSAYRHGFAIAFERGYEQLVQMDADLSHDPAALPQLLGALGDGVGMVIGSRYVPGGQIPHWPAYRRFLSKYGNLYTRTALGLKITDTTSGYRAWRVDTLKAIDVLDTTASGYLFQIELAYRVVQRGERLAEVPITFTDRVRGASKMNGAVVFEELTNVTWWGLRDRVFRRGKRH
jgi:dolichol-phosphate mannosyltransferase